MRINNRTDIGLLVALAYITLFLSSLIALDIFLLFRWLIGDPTWIYVTSN